MKILLLFFIVLILSIGSYHNSEKRKKKSGVLIEVKKDTIVVKSTSPKYSLRKYKNVKQFYSKIAKKATSICMENNIPPAAVLAMAGLESGWNQGYISKITGNLLSLGTQRGDYELPALRLPILKSNGQMLFDSVEIIKYTGDELNWEDRPPCLKKDYRPYPYAGTPNNLVYFKFNSNEEIQVHIANLTDFVTLFISENSKIPCYRNVRELMDKMVAENGKEILLEKSTAILFINEIGGKPYSFNFRKTWPVKVISIINNAGLADLTAKLYKPENEFASVW
jgi:hypothetical protein